MYIGSPEGGSGTPWVPPQASLSLPPSVGALSIRAEAVVPVTDVWALAVRYGRRRRVITGTSPPTTH